MAPDRGRNGAKESRIMGASAEDFDPEASFDEDESNDSDSASDADAQQDGGRDHYVDVGKSKLRKPKAAALGPQYRGAKISRDAVSDDEDEDDPFMKDFDDEDSEQEIYERNGPNGDAESSSVDEDEEMDETSDMDEGVVGMPSKTTLKSNAARDDRYEMLKSMAKDQKEITSRLAQSNKADAEKGRAVKKQRIGFDKLLGTRIKLQKAMISANTLVGTNVDEVRTAQEAAADAIERAEIVAFKFWYSINELRDDLIDARAGQKRKRSPIVLNTPTSDLWTHMQQQEDSSLPHRNATLQRWSVKAWSATVQPRHSLLNGSERNQPTIIDALRSHTSNPDRLLKKAHTPRSCAPVQLAANITEDENIYDDADFYSLLLTSLLEQKSSESSSLPSIVDLNLDWRREAKTKKNVDTKASKGRKLRYTVHEKLQNFMAPEDRRRWGDRQCEELFGSLFGRKVGLDDVDADGEDGMAVDEDERLMLFGN